MRLETSMRPNQLLPVAKHKLEPVAHFDDLQVAATASDHDLMDHEPAMLDKSLPCYNDKQKLDFALNKMTSKTGVTAAQKAKSLGMLQQNRKVFSLPGDKPTLPTN
uniref:Uncharacterized protein n=1 Tax=Romanomermis culicivorax TaxID=13658 RepID=A0A915I8N9_ROMCU